MQRIVILSSYGFARSHPRESVTARGFIAALEEDGWREGIDCELEIHHASRLSAHEDFLRERLGRPLDLVYAGGASLMEVARRMLRESDATRRPLIYWGSHIVDRNMCINPLPDDENILGVILNMPLFYNHRQFRLLQMLFPRLESVYCAFSTESGFCVSTVQENYESALAELGADCWIDSRSRFGGYPGLGRLAAVFGLTFYEHPCTDPEAIRAAVENIPRSRASSTRDSPAVLLSCLDCFHIPGAVEAILGATSASGLPWVGLNFGPCDCADGPLMVFENDLHHASGLAGKLASRTLRGTPPGKLESVKEDRFVFRLNEEKAKKERFEIPPLTLHQIQKQFAIAPLESSESYLAPS